MRTVRDVPIKNIITAVNLGGDNARSSVTIPAAAGNVRHMCTGLTVTMIDTGGSNISKNARLRDGVLDTGTILWQSHVGVSATAGTAQTITRSNLWIPGSPGTAMTLEFDSAGPSNVSQSVSIEVEDIVE